MGNATAHADGLVKCVRIHVPLGRTVSNARAAVTATTGLYVTTSTDNAIAFLDTRAQSARNSVRMVNMGFSAKRLVTARMEARAILWTVRVPVLRVGGALNVKNEAAQIPLLMVPTAHSYAPVTGTTLSSAIPGLEPVFARQATQAITVTVLVLFTLLEGTVETCATAKMPPFVTQPMANALALQDSWEKNVISSALMASTGGDVSTNVYVKMGPSAMLQVESVTAKMAGLEYFVTHRALPECLVKTVKTNALAKVAEPAITLLANASVCPAIKDVTVK